MMKCGIIYTHFDGMYRGERPLTFKEVFTMKVNPITVKFVLDLVAALAVTAAGVVSKYYIDAPQGN